MQFGVAGSGTMAGVAGWSLARLARLAGKRGMAGYGIWAGKTFARLSACAGWQ